MVKRVISFVALIFFAAGLLYSATYGNLPLVFEENKGQTDSSVQFIARNGRYSAFLTAQGMMLSLGGATVTIRLADAKTDIALQPESILESHSNYLMGTDSSHWLHNVRHYARIRARGIRKGIDLVYHGHERQLEYDLEIAPGADSKSLRLMIDGATGLGLDRGDLVIHTAGGDLRQHEPVAFQGATRVETSYQIVGSNEVAIRVGRYDRGLPMTIDPVLSYSAYLGGTGSDAAQTIAVDSSGSAYIAGSTTSLDFPLKGALQPQPNTSFVAKLNAAGTALVYCTYIGPTAAGRSFAIAVDGSGNAYLTGAAPQGFPITAGAIQGYTSQSNYSNAFVAKLDRTGSSLVFATYLGGDTLDYGTAIAVDASSNVYVSGVTIGRNFPTTPGAFESGATPYDTGFVAKLNPTGTALIFSTLLGYYELHISALALDHNGSAFVTGTAWNYSLPTTSGALQPNYAPSSFATAFVTKFKPDGTGLIYSTYLGGSLQDLGNGIAVDADGYAYVAGTTWSSDFPVTTSLAESTTGAAFVTKLNPAGSALVYSVRFGSNGAPVNPNYPPPLTVSGMALDASRNVIVTGNTQYPDFPITADAVQSSVTYEQTGVNGDFITKLNAQGNALIYSTFVGGPQQITAMAVDAASNVYVAGGSGIFPQTAIGLPNGSYGDAFVAKITDGSCNASLTPASATVAVGGGNVNVSVTANAGCLWATVTPAGWTTVSQGVSGTGNGTVTLNVQANPNPARTNVLSIAGHRFTIVQQSSCVYNVVYTPPVVLTSAGGNAGTFTVSSVPTCWFTATSNASWLSVSYYGNNGTGNGGFGASPNFSPNPRTTTVTVADKTFTITQPGGYVCSYIVAPLSALIPGEGGDVRVNVTTAPGCTWAATPNNPWISVISAYPTTESGMAYLSVAPSTAGPRTGTISIAGQTFTVNQGGDGVSPSFGRGSTQTFTFTFSDANGNQDINGVQIVINSTLTAVNSCYILLARPELITLAGDSGLSFTSSTLGAPVVLQNSQCLVLVSQSSQASSGNVFTLNVAVVFKPGFAGAKSIWTNAGTTSSGKLGWELDGSYEATAPTQGLTATAVSPATGAGQASAFSFSYFDPYGAPDISGGQIVFNNSLTGVNGCYVLFNGNNVVSLANDAGIPGTAVPFGSQTVLQNSQCAVYVSYSYQTQLGQNLNVTLFIAFKPAFTGAKNIYSSINSNAGSHSSFPLLGSWNVAGTTPAAGLVWLDPLFATGPSQAMTFVFADPAGYTDITTSQVILNPIKSTTHSCVIQFTRSTGTIMLLDDNGAAANSASLGSPAVLQNSQCVVNAAASSQFGSGNYLLLKMFVTMKSNTSVSTYATVNGTSSTALPFGSWDVTAPAAMTPILAAPLTAAGPAGSFQPFTFTMSDPAGASDIDGTLIVLYPSLQGTNACYILWGRAAGLSLASNDATAFTTGALHSTGLLQNTQCIVDPSKSFEVDAGNTVNLTVWIAFKPPFQAFTQIYSWLNVGNVYGRFSGWSLLSRFTVQ